VTRGQFVAVHDAARPLLSARDLQAVIQEARASGAASLAAPVADTLKRADADGCVTEAVDRAQLWAMQTPQVFRTEALRSAYELVLQSGEVVTDEVSAVAKIGTRVKLVPAQDFNFKITYSCDIALARLALHSLPEVES
jgi:2-C-methyl-D-erythritol 4-phosphate cytidylyltransferase